jgi:predicted MFS family arabinose efflux permease
LAVSAPSRPFPWVPLLTLSTTSFVAVTSEFLPTGLLPEMAEGLGVSESQVGFLVTLFAATVVITAAPLTAVTRNVSRKSLLITVLLVFVAANAFAAVAPTYETLAAARILGGAAHGVFWAVLGPYTALLVGRAQLAKGVAVSNAGGTAAFVLGIPAGTALGHALDWRLAFLVIAGIVLALTVLVAVVLPPVEHRQKLATGEVHLPVRHDPTIPIVVVACLTVLLFMTGQNVYSTYIVPWLLEVPEFAPDATSGILLLQGIAGAVGLLLAGHLGDRYPRAALPGFMIGVLLSVVVLAMLGPSQPVALAALTLWMLFFGGIPALMHARVLTAASPRIRDQSAAFLTVAFNLGIGGGAALGGGVIDGWGVPTLPWVQVAFWVVAIAFVLVTTFSPARSPREAVPVR